MAQVAGINSDQGRVDIRGSIGSLYFDDVSTKEVFLGESLLNPALQVAVTFQSHLSGKKNWDTLKKEQLILSLSSVGAQGSLAMNLDMPVYRLDNRMQALTNVSRVEEFTIHACHWTLLADAKHLMSKSWKCTSPDKIVDEALRCLETDSDFSSNYSKDIQKGLTPNRDYVAENIHPFQVIAQQANAALDGDDPSLLHYMTFESDGKHYFKSLRQMAQGPVKRKFYYYETGNLGGRDYPNYLSDRSIIPAITFTFPCDFDLLSDILNGLNPITGDPSNTFAGFNFGNMGGEGIAGIGKMAAGFLEKSCYEGYNFHASPTNKGNAQETNTCETNVEKSLLKRQARMGLLDRDRIALRLTAPWTPDVHVGEKIFLDWKNEKDETIYGSGEYIVASLMHKIQAGGFGTTTFDCISLSAGSEGVV